MIPWGREDPLKQEVATLSRTVAWEIPRKFLPEEPGRLQSTGSQRVGHDLAMKHKLCSAGNSTQHCVITYMGKEPEKVQIHVHVKLSHCDVRLS